MKKIFLLVLIFAMSFPLLGYAASFDCAKASSAVEKMICSGVNVSKLDEKLALAYKGANEISKDKNALKTQQREWLKQKRNTCENADCLGKTYQARIEELTNSTTKAPSPHLINTLSRESKAVSACGRANATELGFDLDGNGEVNTLSIHNNVHFDLDNSGFSEQTSWVLPSDGLLVLDRNHNNYIDGGAELFGSETLLKSGKKAKDGFEAMAEFDTNNNGKIDSKDTVFIDLKMWRDSNRNGIGEANELANMVAAGIKFIDLTKTDNPFRDDAGVLHSEKGTFMRTNNTTSIINSLCLEADTRNTIPVAHQQGNVPVLPADILALPDAKGFGNNYSLRQAMALDATGNLKQAVLDFTQATDPAGRKLLVTKILTLWTHQENTPVNSRGEFVNAKHLGVLENVWGKAAQQQNPSGAYAAAIQTAYAKLEQSVYSELMRQTHVKSLMANVSFSQASGNWRADFSTATTLLAASFAQGNAGAEVALQDFAEVVRGLNSYTTNLFYRDFLNAMNTSAAILSEAQKDTIFSAIRNENDELAGTVGADSINGYSGNDVLNGLAGDDNLVGGIGNDYLNGHEGNDALAGGQGYDTLRGGAGNDTYYFELNDGSDQISDLSGNDILRLGKGILENQVTVSYDGSSLVLTLNATDMIIINDIYDDKGILSGGVVEKIHFASGIEWDIAKMQREAIKGSTEDDYLVGFCENDIYNFRREVGNDTIDDAGGVDTIILGAGITTNQVNIERSGSDLVITLDTLETITVTNMFDSETELLNSVKAVEFIIFSDKTIWDFNKIQQAVLNSKSVNK